jgi:hypothetical protein
MITIELTPDQIATLSDSISQNFAQEQPDRIYCYEMNGNKVENDFLFQEAKNVDTSWTRESSSLYFFERRMESHIFYNFIVHHTTLNAVLCSDECSGTEPFVVAVDISISQATDLANNELKFSNLNTNKK